MKMFKTIISIVVLLSLSALLFGAAINEPVVLYLRAYIPERTTFIEVGGELSVESNAYNFTYSMVDQGFERTVAVIAN